MNPKATVDLYSSAHLLTSCSSNGYVIVSAWQAAGLVPIVEPEILIDGTHSIERAQEVAGLVIGRVMEKLTSKKVDLEACLLKIQMVMPGSEANKADPDTIAEATISMLSRQVLPDQETAAPFSRDTLSPIM